MTHVRLVAAAGLAGLLGLAATMPHASVNPEPEPPAASTHVARPELHAVRFFNEDTLRRSLIEVRGRPVVPPDARIVIVPHHWLAGDLIVRGLSGIEGIDRVVLIGPDHANVGRAQVTTVAWRWQTPFGVVEPDRAAIRRLQDSGLAAQDSNVFAAEHAIDGLVPAVAAFSPGAKILPLAVRSKMNARRATALARALASSMDGRTLVIASVDFSHHLPEQLARQRNVETIEALRAMDLNRILRFGNEHLDSSGSIGTVIQIARGIGATSFSLLDSSTSADRGGHPSDVTSYILGYYS